MSRAAATADAASDIVAGRYRRSSDGLRVAMTVRAAKTCPASRTGYHQEQGDRIGSVPRVRWKDPERVGRSESGPSHGTFPQPKTPASDETATAGPYGHAGRYGPC